MQVVNHRVWSLGVRQVVADPVKGQPASVSVCAHKEFTQRFTAKRIIHTLRDLCPRVHLCGRIEHRQVGFGRLNNRMIKHICARDFKVPDAVFFERHT